MKKVRKNYGLSPESVAWLQALAEQEGATETAMIERLIRAEAKRRKLPRPKEDTGS